MSRTDKADAWRALMSGESTPTRPGLVVVKDNIDVAGRRTTAGSSLLQHTAAATRDAAVVTRLRSGGFTIGPKANMHELALGSTGVNPTFGTVLNPQAMGRIAGGSSSGTAAAVAGGISELGLGTDTGGSVRVPASLTGTAGFRPTTGRYESAGVVPLCRSRDTVGTMATSVRGLVALDAALARTGRRGPRTVTERPAPDALRLGVPGDFFVEGLDLPTQTAWNWALGALRERGVTLVELDVHRLAATEAQLGAVVTCYEAAADLVPYLVQRTGVVDTLALTSGIASPDVRALIEERVVPGAPDAISTGAYANAMRLVERLRADYSATLETQSLTGLIFPTTPEVATPIERLGKSNFHKMIRNTVPGSLAASPGVTVPIPMQELPVGFALDGRPGDDVGVLGAALTIESMLRDSAIA